MTKFFHEGVGRFNRIDFAANVAGYAHKVAPTHELAESEYDKSYQVNQKGVPNPLDCIHALALTMATGILLRAGRN